MPQTFLDGRRLILLRSRRRRRSRATTARDDRRRRRATTCRSRPEQGVAPHRRAPGRRQAADADAGFPRRPPRRPAGACRRRHDRAGARRRLRHPARRFLPAALICPPPLRGARTSLADERDRALAAEIATGVQRWRAALDYLIVLLREASDRPPRPRGCRDPAPERLPAAAPDARARIGGRRRCGEPGATGRQAERGRLRQRRAADRVAAAGMPCRCPRDPRIRPIGQTPSTTWLSRSRIRGWLAARWYDRLGFDAAEAWMRFNNAPAPLTLRANRLRMTPRRA